MTPEQLSDTIVAALTSLVDDGRVTLPDAVPTAVRVERPKVKEHGDYATNIALQLGKKAGMNPREFAELLAAELAATDGVAGAEVAGPGFLNIRVAAGAQGEIARHVLEAGEGYGRNDLYAGQAINLRIVIANPYCPHHIKIGRTTV